MFTELGVGEPFSLTKRFALSILDRMHAKSRLWMNRFSRVLVTGGVGFIGSYVVDALMLLIACDKLEFMGARCC